MAENNDITEKKELINCSDKLQPKRFLLVTTLFIGLILVSTAFLGIPIPLSLYWITLTYYLYLAPIFIYTAAIMLKPWISFVTCTLGLVLGELILCVIFGCSNELPFYLFFALISRGIQVLIISLLRKRNEVVALVIGGLYEALGLLLVYFIYYRLVLYWIFDFVVIYALLSALLDLLFIPLSLILNLAIRKVFKLKYLDELIYTSRN